MNVIRKTYTIFMRADEEQMEAEAFSKYFNECDAALHKLRTEVVALDPSEVSDDILDTLMLLEETE